MRSKAKNADGTFSVVKQGYDKKEVHDYLNVLAERNENQIKENQARLINIKKENNELKSQLFVFREREDEIKNSLYAANEKASEMTLELKIQYALEIERLRIFQAKWTNCYEELKERYHFGKDALNMESVVTSTALELENLLARDFSLPKENKGSDIEKQFKQEVERLGGGEEEMNSLFDKLKSEMKVASKQKTTRDNLSEQPTAKIAADNTKQEEQFSISRAIHPEQSLEDICRSLGINAK